MFSEGSAGRGGTKEEVAFSKALVYQGRPGGNEAKPYCTRGIPRGRETEDFW